MTQFEIDSFVGASGGGGGVVSGAYQLSGIYQVSGDYAFDFAKQVSGLYVTHSGGFYQPSGIFQVSGDYPLAHTKQASGIYLLTSGGLYQVSGIYPTSGLFALSGTGGAGGGLSGNIAAGEFLGSGNNSTLVYTLSHGLGSVPSSIVVKEGSPQARGFSDVSGNASGIFVTYTSPPASGNVRLYWYAGPTNAVNLVTLGSGNVHAATFLGSGNNSTTLYTLSHGLLTTPTGISVDAASPQARGDIDVSGNASGIFVTYTSPPLSGDVRLTWVAGPSTIAVLASGAWQTSGIYDVSGGGTSGIQTITSGSQITGVISGSPAFQGIVNFSNQITVSGIYMPPDADDAKYVIWESGGVYRTLNKANSTIEYSGTNAFTAIATAQSGAFMTINQNTGPASIKIIDGIYSLPTDFTGFDLWGAVHLRMGKNARITVPYQYSGHAFRITNGNVAKTLIEGGIVWETGSFTNILNSGRNWDGIVLHGSGVAGVAFVTIRDTYIHNANRGIYILSEAGSFVNGNSFEDILIERPRVDIKLEDLSGSDGIGRNHFQNVIGQNISGWTRAGVDLESLAGSMNVFENCKMWDLVGSGVYSCHIGSSGRNTIIIGGIMGSLDFVDNGQGTFIIDEWNGIRYNGSISAESGLHTTMVSFSGISNILRITNLASGQAATVYHYGASGQNNPSWSLWDSPTLNERLLISKSTENIFRSSRQLAAGAVRQTSFQMQDVATGTLIEGMRMNTSGTIEFNRSGGTIQFFSGNTSLTRTVTASMSGAFGPLGFLTTRLGSLDIKIPYFAA